MFRSSYAIALAVVALALTGVAAAADAADPSPVPADAFEFVPTGRLAHGRIWHSATLLPDDRVLVIGGYETATAEIWDPLTGEWTLTGSMAGPREGHRASLLADGRVVVVGGHRSGEEAAPPAEVWDPASEKFSVSALLSDDGDPAPIVPGPPQGEDANRTTLLDGRVLTTGGWEKDDPLCTRGLCGTHPIASASIWDPATGAATEIAPMTVPRTQHTGTLLRDGRVLLVGSHTHGEVDRTAELLQPVGFPDPRTR